MGTVIKFIAAAIWICIVTIGAVIYSFQTSGANAEAKGPALFGGLDYIKTDVISVPILRNARVDGYFLARLVYVVDPAKLKLLTVPVEAILVDEVYSYLYSNPQLDFSANETLDLEIFRAGIRDAINARVQDALIDDILVEQIDFLSKDDIRDNSVRRRTKAIEAGNKAAGLPAPAH
ncbi:hypothetical protein G6N73_11130 [Mesorhizobium camelthorni]|uniref:Uncharacterized protein n=1 Tax=Allomesorhizobium camelthorni TaxID=475069 RepID=A0A6G4WAB8_9HYPH|nr:hypothetical protein [Mesorhizobium camelthorni]